MRVLSSPSEWPAGAQRLQQKREVQMQLASQQVGCASCTDSCRLLGCQFTRCAWHEERAPGQGSREDAPATSGQMAPSGFSHRA